MLLAVSRAARGFADEDAEILQAVANQVALALKKAELIERLTAENAVRDLFDALAARDRGRRRGARTGGGLQPQPPPRDRARRGRRRAGRGARGRRWRGASRRACAAVDAAALCDAGRDHLRALLPLPAVGNGDDVAELVRVAGALGADEGVVPRRQRRAPGHGGRPPQPGARPPTRPASPPR